jgi:hypothetical protein
MIIKDEISGELQVNNSIYLFENPSLFDELNGILDPLLIVDQTVPAYETILIRAQSVRDEINSTVKIHVTVCGDEEVFLLDPENDVFNIYLIGYPGQETWYNYDLSALYATNSSILPTDECPVTHYDICEDENC